MAKGRKTAAAAAPPKDDVEFFYEVEQRSADWHELRRGIVTASHMSDVLASGRDGGESVGREKYMRLLAGEIITGQVAETFRNESMERGIAMEPAAVAWYERTRITKLTPVGFVRRTVRTPLGFDFRIGCSPDAQDGPRKGVEIKSMAPHLLLGVAERGAAGFPPRHRAQLQATMWVCGWDEMELVLYHDGWPRPPTFTVVRSEADIEAMKRETERFCFELEAIVKRHR